MRHPLTTSQYRPVFEMNTPWKTLDGEIKQVMGTAYTADMSGVTARAPCAYTGLIRASLYGRRDGTEHSQIKADPHDDQAMNKRLDVSLDEDNCLRQKIDTKDLRACTGSVIENSDWDL
jgi:hypothetical protein